MSQAAELSPLDKLLALLDQAVASNELPEELAEVIELEPEPLATKLYAMAGDRTLGVPLHEMAILALNELPYTPIRERDDFKQNLIQLLQPVFTDDANSPALRTAAVYVLQENYAFVDDDYEPVEDDDPAARQAVLRQGALQSEAPLITAYCIGQLESDVALTILPQLISSLHSPATKVSGVAAECIGNLGQAAAAAIPAHLQLLQQPDYPHRNQLLRNLGNIGSHPEQTIPVLSEIVKQPESKESGIALISLMQIVVQNELEPTAYFAFLEKSLREKTGKDLINVLGAISLLGIDARSLRPLVKALDRHPDKSVARQARETLRNAPAKSERRDGIEIAGLRR